VLRGDDMARELVTSQLLDTLVPRLRGRFRAARADAITDAVADAILQYLRDPHGFDAVRHRSLEGFIWMLARRNLCNTIRADRRATTRDVEYARQLSTLVTAHDGCQSSDYIAVIDDAVRQEPDTRIRLALRGWLGDQNATALWLAVPLIAALAKADRAVEIKRQKDRFIARLKRVKKRLSAARKRIDEVEMARSGGGDTDRAAEGRNSDSERAQNE
jgi:hypothetical protein